jgi:hypothetical protein
MGGAKKGMNGGSSRDRDAAKWVAENESDGAVDEMTVSIWEEWVARPRNEVEYVAVIDMLEQIRGMPAPAYDGREALVRDALADGGDGG